MLSLAYVSVPWEYFVTNIVRMVRAVWTESLSGLHARFFFFFCYSDKPYNVSLLHDQFILFVNDSAVWLYILYLDANWLYAVLEFSCFMTNQHTDCFNKTYCWNSASSSLNAMLISINYHCLSWNMIMNVLDQLFFPYAYQLSNIITLHPDSSHHTTHSSQAFHPCYCFLSSAGWLCWTMFFSICRYVFSILYC